MSRPRHSRLSQSQRSPTLTAPEAPQVSQNFTTGSRVTCEEELTLGNDIHKEKSHRCGRVPSPPGNGERIDRREGSCRDLARPFRPPLANSRRWSSFICMTPEERTLISTLFDRLNSAAAQAKDPQAEEYIRAKVSQQPSAPYLLVQSTLVMQQALTAAQTRIADLEKQLAAAQRPGQEPSGSFLSGMANLFGVGQSPAQPSRGPQAPPPLPSQSAPLSPLSPPPLPQTGRGPGGGSFLQSALSTAAGVAGGALLFQGIQNLLGHNPGQFGGLVGPSGEHCRRQ